MPKTKTTPIDNHAIRGGWIVRVEPATPPAAGQESVQIDAHVRIPDPDNTTPAQARQIAVDLAEPLIRKLIRDWKDDNPRDGED